MRENFHRALILSGTGAVNVTVPVRCRLVELVMTIASVSTTTAAQGNFAQLSLTSVAALQNNGSASLLATIEAPIGPAVGNASNTLRLTPNLLLQPGQILTMFVSSGTGCTAYADATLIFEPY